MSDLIKYARPYAKAAFSIALEQKSLADWSVMLNTASHIARDPRVADMITNPSIESAHIASVFTDIGGDRFDEAFCRLLSVLAENDRLAILSDIAVMYEQLRQEEEKRMPVKVVSAIELNTDTLGRMQSALEARFDKQVTIETEIDSSLLGGAIIIADDLVIDGSVRGRLNKMTASLVE